MLDTVLSQSLTTDGLLTSVGETLSRSLAGCTGEIVTLLTMAGNYGVTGGGLGAGGTSGTDWAGGIVLAMVTSSTSDGTTSHTSLGLGGERSELALTFDAVLVVLNPVSIAIVFKALTIGAYILGSSVVGSFSLLGSLV